MPPEEKRHLINIALEKDHIAQNKKCCELIRSLMTSDSNLDVCIEIISDIRNSVSTLIYETKNWVADRASQWDRSLFVTLTFRFEPNQNKVLGEFNTFKKLLSRDIYKNAFRRYGKEVEMASVIAGDSITNPHIHCHIRIPDRLETSEFKELITKYWRSGFADIRDCDENHSQITGYLLKNDSTAFHTRQCLDL